MLRKFWLIRHCERDVQDVHVPREAWVPVAASDATSRHEISQLDIASERGSSVTAPCVTLPPAVVAMTGIV